MKREQEQEKDKENEELLNSLQTRLYRLAYEVPEDELDFEELDAIENLMEKFAPMPDGDFFTAEKALGRFQDYCEQREYEETVQEECGIWELMPETIEDGEFENVEVLRKRRFLSTSGGKIGTITAAVLMIVVLAGGSIGASAEKNTGFFYFLRKDKSGAEFIVAGDGETTSTQMEYFAELYKDDIQIGVHHFSADMVGYTISYEGYEFIKELMYDNVSFMVYQKIVEDESNDYAVCFYDNSSQYFVEGSLELESIIDIAKIYANDVINK